jgi:hypothetical protein
VGFSGVLFLVDQEAGKALTVTFWKSEQSMQASDEEVNRLRRESAEAAGETIEAINHKDKEVPVLEVGLVEGNSKRGD